MRQLAIILVCLFTMCSCSQDRVFNSDVEKLTANRLLNNQIEIENILKEAEKRGGQSKETNMPFVKRMQDLHQSILDLNKEVDAMDKNTALHRVKDFVVLHFEKMESNNRTNTALDQETPKSLMKLHLATLEAFLIQEWADELYGKVMRLDSIAVVIVPSKMVVKKGEKITGKAAIALFSRYADTKVMFSQIVINGRELKHGKDAWEFELEAKSKGAEPIELSAEAVYSDPKIEHRVKGRQIVHVQE
ncbi:MAG: hypothetical protein HYZ44_10965 [Bacteroidetes bacterium]|nr:hypothetical protein [Bacteroidota bacterium]